MSEPRSFNRRHWLVATASACAAMLPQLLWAQGPPAAGTLGSHPGRANHPVPGDPHPTPRRGITGAKVATAEMLDGDPVLTELFESIRAIPHVVDGIRCHCGCADLQSHYSLLSCYEGANAMARICPICQGEGRVAVRMHKAGRTLADIRIAIDAQYG